MRLTCVCAGLAGLLLVTVTPSFSQRMLEYGLAAAGGSASGAAGKGVSDGLNKIFRKLDKQNAARAQEIKRMKPQPATPPNEGAVRAPDLFPRGSGSSRRSQPPRVAVEGGVPQGSGWWTSSSGAVPPVEASVEELQSVEAGTQRRDVVARLGTPSARIFIPEEGQLREVYLFDSRGTHLGRVNLTNGEVSNVVVDPMAR